MATIIDYRATRRLTPACANPPAAPTARAGALVARRHSFGDGARAGRLDAEERRNNNNILFEI